ncbi:hypothetical protein [Streptomyces marianii]|uniref:Uncharacterized protein n=1 Tax=Streptomyces marianii TaxID=1817406 RepID=A0A5R9DR74_9ACTN|nr:hypothetical protein [Streptomyces marianii]TLQ38999.1 hypothetical protein FEF34_40005 [Streptomyces marianii]
MQQVQTISQARAARRHAHWQERQRRQLEQRGEAGLAEAWWDRVRALCKERAAAGDPEPWKDLARTLENWVERQTNGDST